jgi:hypothetical protein
MDVEKITREGMFANALRSADDTRDIITIGGDIEIHFFDYGALAQEDAYKFNKVWYAFIEHPLYPHMYYGDLPGLQVQGEQYTYGIERKHTYIDYFTFGFRNPYACYKFEALADLCHYKPVSPMQAQ